MNRDVLNEAERERVADVFQSHRGFVESVAARHVAHPQDVPDVVQAVAVQVCRGLNGFRDEAQLTTWLYRVTVNTARTHFRRERRQARAVEAIQCQPAPEPAVDPDEQVIMGERSQALHDALERLQPDRSQALRDQMSGCSVISDRTKRYWARRDLRDLLAGDPRVTG